MAEGEFSSLPRAAEPMLCSKLLVMCDMIDKFTMRASRNEVQRQVFDVGGVSQMR